jgi:MYXO-CTERM domain-containing protein
MGGGAGSIGTTGSTTGSAGASSSTASTTTGDGTGTMGAGGAGNPFTPKAEQGSGCSCRAGADSNEGHALAGAWLLGIGIVATRRRWKRQPPGQVSTRPSGPLPRHDPPHSSERTQVQVGAPMQLAGKGLHV